MKELRESNVEQSSYEEASILNLAKKPKLAIVMIETKSDFDRAQKLLEEAGGFVSKAISIAGGTEDLTR